MSYWIFLCNYGITPRTGCKAAAADIAQDTFLKFQEALLKGLKMKFQEEEDVLRYLTTTAKNLAKDRFKKTSRFVQLEENWDSGKQHNPYSAIDLQQDLATQLKQVSSKQAEMLELQKAGHSYQEIADTMGMKIEAVRKSLYRCREKLKLLKSG